MGYAIRAAGEPGLQWKLLLYVASPATACFVGAMAHNSPILDRWCFLLLRSTEDCAFAGVLLASVVPAAAAVVTGNLR